MTFAQVDPKANNIDKPPHDTLQIDTIRILHEQLQNELREIMKKSDETKPQI